MTDHLWHDSIMWWVGIMLDLIAVVLATGLAAAVVVAPVLVLFAWLETRSSK